MIVWSDDSAGADAGQGFRDLSLVNDFYLTQIIFLLSQSEKFVETVHFSVLIYFRTYQPSGRP